VGFSFSFSFFFFSGVCASQQTATNIYLHKLRARELYYLYIFDIIFNRLRARNYVIYIYLYIYDIIFNKLGARDYMILMWVRMHYICMDRYILDIVHKFDHD
jgi:hypothetical protein